jgi:hypothetical protein
MPKKTLLLLGAIALVFIITSIFLGYQYDSVKVINNPVPMHDFSGETKTVDLLIYEPEHRLARVASELLGTIAIALFIYFVIERTLITNQERQQKKEQEEYREKLTRDVLHEVLKRFIPKGLADSILKDILSQYFIAENVFWEYTIEDCTSHYKVIQKCTYDFHNITSTTQQLPFRLKVYQNSNNKSWFDLVRVSKKQDEGEEILFSETRKEIEEKAILVGNAKMRVHQLDVKPDKSVTVTYKVVNVYDSKFVQDIHFSNYSITDLNIRVNSRSDCQFSAIGTFAEPLKEKSADDDVIHYEMIKGILKGQSFIFFIEPKTKEEEPEPIQQPISVISNRPDEEVNPEKIEKTE